MSIKIEKTEVVGWEHAIRGMRNPKNSWDRMDTVPCGDTDMTCSNCPHSYICDMTLGDNEKTYIVGPNDHKLMMNLAAGGPVHAKYRRMITVYVDITAPLYWWKEFDTYKVGTVANSCSTMHKIQDKEFTLDDFSCEHLISNWDTEENKEAMSNWYCDGAGIDLFASPLNGLELIIRLLNANREAYLKAKTKPMKEEFKRAELMKKYWWQMIQLLPSSYNQKRTVMLNYEVLAGIYPMRRNHKLDEWHDFCRWIESLPYSEIMIPEMYSDEEMPSPDEEMDAWFKEYGNCTGCKYAEKATTADPCFGCIRIFGNVDGKDLFEHGDPDWEDK